MHFFGVDAIVGGGLNTLAVLAAEVMTVTNPLAFQTVLGWPGLQTIARFHYYLFFFASDFCTVLVHLVVASVCGRLAKPRMHIYLSAAIRTCTHSSRKAPEEKCPRLFML
jgi:hypothetical protein